MENIYITEKGINEKIKESRIMSLIYMIFSMITLFISIPIGTIFVVITLVYFIDYRYWCIKSTLLNITDLTYKKEELEIKGKKK